MSIKFLEYAAIAGAAYYPLRTATGHGFGRYSPMRREMSGFQGAIYRRTTAGTNAWVVGIAGTQPTDGGGADVVADAGFGGIAGLAFGPLGAVVSLAGAVMLSRQCTSAEQLVAEARAAMGHGDTISITGHSLGGGIAQIVAARTGITAMAFNSPAVTAVGGVADAYARNKPKITNLKVKKDPINHSGAFGEWLGKVVILMSPRTGGAAHSIDQTIAELSPAGSFSNLGFADPFA